MPMKWLNREVAFAESDVSVESIKFDFGSGPTASITDSGTAFTHRGDFGEITFSWKNFATNRNTVKITTTGNINNTLFPADGFNFKVIYKTTDGNTLTQPINLKIVDSTPKPNNYKITSAEIYFNADIYVNVFIEITPNTTAEQLTNFKTTLKQHFSAYGDSVYVNTRTYGAGGISDYSTNGTYRQADTTDLDDDIDAIISNLSTLQVIHNSLTYTTPLFTGNETAPTEESTHTDSILSFIFNSFNDPLPTSYVNAVYIYGREDALTAGHYDPSLEIFQRMDACQCPVIFISSGNSSSDIVDCLNMDNAGIIPFELHRQDISLSRNTFFNIPCMSSELPANYDNTLIPNPGIIRHLEHFIDYYDTSTFEWAEEPDLTYFNLAPKCNAIGHSNQFANTFEEQLVELKLRIVDSDSTPTPFNFNFGDPINTVVIEPQATLRPHLEFYSNSGSGGQEVGHVVNVPCSQFSTFAMKFFGMDSQDYAFSVAVTVDSTEQLDDVFAKVVNGYIQLVFPSYPFFLDGIVTFGLTITCHYGVDYSESDILETEVSINIAPYTGLRIDYHKIYSLTDLNTNPYYGKYNPIDSNLYVDTTIMNSTWLRGGLFKYGYYDSLTDALDNLHSEDETVILITSVPVGIGSFNVRNLVLPNYENPGVDGTVKTTAYITLPYGVAG